MLSDPEQMFHELYRRVNIPINSSTPPELQAAILHDPFNESAKYGLLFVYIFIILFVIATMLRMYNYWGDKIRTALYKEEIVNSAKSWSPGTPIQPEYELPSSQTDSSTRHFFPTNGPLIPEKPQKQAAVSAIAPINNTIAFFRWIFYRPMPQIKIGSWRFTFPSLSVIVIVVVCLVAAILYCFLPQPLFYDTMAYGSPPLAIRAGMMSVSLVPWGRYYFVEGQPDLLHDWHGA